MARFFEKFFLVATVIVALPVVLVILNFLFAWLNWFFVMIRWLVFGAYN